MTKRNDMNVVRNLLDGIERDHAAEVKRLSDAGKVLTSFIRALTRDPDEQPSDQNKVAITEALRLFERGY